ncbi:hypothetical protein HDV06_003954 [Boothiomyces sp. JEL0866]|nr:hypothetical protein HDV06_003954 [Boothiomyces sp. JEL0866]
MIAAVALLATQTLASSAPTPRFKRFFQIIMENTDLSVALEQPYMKSILPLGRLYNNMHGITHPSQPNYIAMIAGDVMGVIDDDNHDLTGVTIADTLEEAGKTWVTYQETYPGGVGNCYTQKDTITGDLRLYERKHNPFMSYTAIQTTARCDNIKNSDFLDKDIAAGKVADYVMYVPNQINDGHGANYSNALNTSTLEYSFQRIQVGDAWLSKFLPKYINNPFFADTLFLLTFDENDAVAKVDTTDNTIYTIAIGAGVEANTVDTARYDHYSQIALLNKEWGLKPLGKADVTATPFDLGNPASPGKTTTAVAATASAPCTTIAQSPKATTVGNNYPSPPAYTPKSIYSSASSYSFIGLLAVVFAL